MKYTTGEIGRVIVVRFEHGEDVIAGTREIVLKEGVRSAIAFFVGAVEAARMVAGPEKLEIPPEPHWIQFADGREILGIGTIFMEGNEPKMHLHGAAGRGEHSLAGCFRNWAKVFLIVECVIIEIKNCGAKRSKDEASGLSLLDFEEPRG